MRKLSIVCLALAGALSLQLTPARACPNMAEIDATAPHAASSAAAATRAWPVPGFDRMLADSRSSMPAAAPRAHPDVLYPFFQAQLWNAPPARHFASASRAHREEM